MIDIYQLKTNPKNPRTIKDKAFQKLVKKIEDFPQMLAKRPIVYDSKNESIILGGNRRYDAVVALLKSNRIELKEEYFADAADWTDEQKRKFVVIDNVSDGEWDWDKLANQYEAPELLEWGLELPKSFNPGGTEEDEPPALSKEPAKSKRGEIYQLGNHRLMCDDATSAEDASKLMQGKQADMIFTDPPWNVEIGQDSNPRHRQREGLINDNLGEGFLDFLRASSVIMAQFCKGDIYCVMGCEEWPNIHRALTDAGLHWSATIIWVKDIFVLGRSKYHRRYEPIWYGWLNKSSFVADRKQDDIWEIPRPRISDEHPTMKPIALVAEAINNSSEPESIVLDIFGGSGSTLIACEQLNRTCYMMEIDPKYCDVIRKRYYKYINNGNTEGWEQATPVI